MDYRARYCAQARQRGFGETEIADWLGLLRFYVDVSPDPTGSAGQLPAGRLGGAPRLGVGQAWPMVFPQGFTEEWPLDYIGEVDCAGLPETDVALPANGKLAFFVDDDLTSHFVDREAKGPLCRVVYVPAGIETTALPPPDDVAIAEEHDLYAWLRYTFPGWLDLDIDDPVFEDFRQRVPHADALWELAEQIWPEDAAQGPRPGEAPSDGIELGPPHSSPQTLPEQYIALEKLAAEHGYASASTFAEADESAVPLADTHAWQLLRRQEWVSLARFESPENETFFHRFVIHRDDLVQQRFDQVRNFLEH